MYVCLSVFYLLLDHWRDRNEIFRGCRHQPLDSYYILRTYCYYLNFKVICEKLVCLFFCQLILQGWQQQYVVEGCTARCPVWWWTVPATTHGHDADAPQTRCCWPLSEPHHPPPSHASCYQSKRTSATRCYVPITGPRPDDATPRDGRAGGAKARLLALGKTTPEGGQHSFREAHHHCNVTVIKQCTASLVNSLLSLRGVWGCRPSEGRCPPCLEGFLPQAGGHAALHLP